MAFRAGDVVLHLPAGLPLLAKRRQWLPSAVFAKQMQPESCACVRLMQDDMKLTLHVMIYEMPCTVQMMENNGWVGLRDVFGMC